MRQRITKILLVVSLLLISASDLYSQYDKQQFYARGRQLLVEGKYSQAIEIFNVLVQIDTINYEANFLRGIAKYNLGDFYGAESDFNTTLRKNPIHTPSYHYRAITLSRIGKYDLALKDLEEAVDLRPSYTGLYFSRGVTYFLSQQFEKAISDFNRFIKYEPKVQDAYLNRGAAYLYLGDTLKALDDYNVAINLNRFEPEGYIRRARIYQMKNSWNEALSDLDKAINLDSANTFAYFNRALLRYNVKNIKGTLEDFEKILKYEPNNALTLYNRALIRSQIGDFNNALDDYDKVLEINPENVLAYYNRASLFTQLGRWRDAMDDYSQAINLYPDFANAYMNRSFVKNRLGQFTSAKTDYQIALKKIQEYKNIVADSTGAMAFADTTKKYDNLLALDADFARKEFDNELLQHRDVDIRLKPLYKFALVNENTDKLAMEHFYYNAEVSKFISSIPYKSDLVCAPVAAGASEEKPASTISENIKEDMEYFGRALTLSAKKQFNAALDNYNKAIEKSPDETFYYMNRGVLQAEMIEFISSIESNVRVLTLDNAGTARAKVQDGSQRSYDYTPAIHDMLKAASLFPEFPYTYYNLGNLYSLSNDLPEAIKQYSAAIDIYPYLPEAYYNRGLVLIYLKDKDKGCMDISKAGELGIREAYSVIKKYCSTKTP